MPTRHSLRFACALAAAVLGAGGGAAGQGFGHGLPPSARPLHVRLAQADVVAFGVVEAVETGRIAVAQVHALRGQPGAGFQVKRAPSRAPELTPGERVLWLLRGARAPYILVDEPRELARLADAAQEARWRAGLEDLLAADGEVALRDVYLGWIDGPDDGLREEAVRALADRRTRPLPLDAGLAVARARVALDAARPSAVRQASAALACLEPSGTRALLAGLAQPGVDPGVVRLALAWGAMQRSDGLPAALAASLRHADPEVRRAALAVAGRMALQPLVRSALEQVAARDEDPHLREQARKALESSSPDGGP